MFFLNELYESFLKFLIFEFNSFETSMLTAVAAGTEFPDMKLNLKHFDTTAHPPFMKRLSICNV